MWLLPASFLCGVTCVAGILCSLWARYEAPMWSRAAVGQSGTNPQVVERLGSPIKEKAGG